MINCLRKDKYRSVLGWFFFGLFSFAEILGYLMLRYETKYDLKFSLSIIGLCLLGGVVLGFLLIPLFIKISELTMQDDKTHTDVVDALKTFMVYFAIIFASYVPCLLAFYPGLYNNDMSFQWGMVVANIYYEHHPIIHTLFAGGILEEGFKVFGNYQKALLIHSLIQMFIISSCMSVSLVYMKKWRINKVFRNITLVFFCIYPFFAVLSISTTKDVIFGALTLVVVSMAADMIIEGAWYKGWKFASFIVVCVLWGLFRNNAIYAIILWIIILFASLLFKCFRKKKSSILKIIGFSISIIILTITGQRLLAKATHAQPVNIAETLSVPAQQIGRIYQYHKEELTDEELKQIDRYVLNDGVKDYVYWISDPVKNNLNSEEIKKDFGDFLEFWIKLGIKYPVEFITAPLYTSFGTWYLSGDSSCSVSYDMSEPLDDLHKIECHSKLQWLNKIYRWFVYDNLVSIRIITFIFFTPFYTWCMMLSLFKFFADRKNKLAIIPGLLLCYVVTLALGPCMAVRYAFPVLICIPLTLGIAFRNGENYEPYRCNDSML